LQVCDVVIAETAYVLISVYKVHRESVVDTLVRFFQKENIRPFALEKDMLLHALLICRSSGRVSFADALVCATAQSTEEKVVYSLDECFSQESVEVRMGNNPET
jgi:predicted nucleic acid-binding protein